MKKISIVPLTLALLLLAGCSWYAPNAITEDITKKAVTLKDKTICESLQGAAERMSCIGTVADSIQTDVALASGDLNACESVVDPQYKKACELATTSKAREQQGAKEENDKLQKAQNGTSLVACDELKNDQAKDQCQIAILSKMAYEQKDEKICLQIKREGARKMCQASLGVDVQ